MADALLGKQLNNFRIERLLGRGGMAQVYYGIDIGLNRPVAIKVIDERWRHDEQYTARFISEAQTVAQWRHDNIIQVYYAGNENDLYYFVMEYIDGKDLTTYMNNYFENGEMMPYDRIIFILNAVASGLDYAHHRGVIHRDVKPSNIMLGDDNRVVLMDFGLALDVDKGTIGESFGTPHYIAPEQAVNASTATAHSDQYALGVIAYEMLTGKVPFDNPSAMNVAIMHINEEPPRPTSVNPELNNEVESVLLKVLSKQPSDRFPSCQAFVQTLENAIAGRPTLIDDVSPSQMGKILITPPAQSDTQTVPGSDQSPTPPTEQRLQTPSAGKKSRLPLTLVVSAVIVIVVLGAILALSGGNNQPAPEVSPSADAQLIDIATNTAIPTTESTSTSVPSTTADNPTETVIPPTTTDVPTATPVPATATDLPTATSVPTQAPTNIIIPPTATDMPANTPVPIISEPTLAYPDGSPIVLYYDDTSFYVWNPTSDRVRAGNFKFQALDGSGNILASAFDGIRWTQFYSFIDGGGCVAIEITTGSPLNPPECREENALVNTTVSSDLVFWTGQRISGFRVLWQDAEISRCETSAGECNFNIP